MDMKDRTWASCSRAPGYDVSPWRKRVDRHSGEMVTRLGVGWGAAVAKLGQGAGVVPLWTLQRERGLLGLSFRLSVPGTVRINLLS